MLTDLKVKRYKTPEGAQKILWDRGGLGILIGKKKKTWIFRYSFDGRRLMLKMGEYPAMSLEAAQREAAEDRLKVAEGIDPGAEKKLAKEARKAAPTVADFVEEFDTVELKNKKSGKETKRLLLHDVAPDWGGRKVADVKRRDIVVLLDTIRERAPITANRVHSALSRMFNFAAERGVIEDSPCTRIRKTKETARERVLTDGDINRLWAGMETANKAIDVYAVTRLALKMVLVTGQRPGEVCGMAWDELDLEKKIWTIPAGRMKGKTAHTVPLISIAVEIIEQSRAYSGDSPYVFRSERKASAPITPGSLSRAVLRHWQEMGFTEPFTPHDLRRTLRTRLAELGVSDIVAERTMGHKLQGVLGVYNRHPYGKEKREALELWEALLRLIVGLDAREVAKIIPIRG